MPKTASKPPCWAPLFGPCPEQVKIPRGGVLSHQSRNILAKPVCCSSSGIPDQVDPALPQFKGLIKVLVPFSSMKRLK